MLGRKIRFLLVEDNEDHAQLVLREMAAADGVDCDLAHVVDGEQALVLCSIEGNDHAVTIGRRTGSGAYDSATKCHLALALWLGPPEDERSEGRSHEQIRWSDSRCDTHRRSAGQGIP